MRPLPPVRYVPSGPVVVLTVAGTVGAAVAVDADVAGADVAGADVAGADEVDVLLVPLLPQAVKAAAAASAAGAIQCIRGREPG